MAAAWNNAFHAIVRQIPCDRLTRPDQMHGRRSSCGGLFLAHQRRLAGVTWLGFESGAGHAKMRLRSSVLGLGPKRFSWSTYFAHNIFTDIRRSATPKIFWSVAFEKPFARCPPRSPPNKNPRQMNPAARKSTFPWRK